jgi:hypothetical protein
MEITPAPNRSRHLYPVAATSASGTLSTEITSCQTCAALAEVPFLQGRQKCPDGSFGTPFVIEVRF